MTREQCARGVYGDLCGAVVDASSVGVLGCITSLIGSFFRERPSLFICGVIVYC